MSKLTMLALTVITAIVLLLTVWQKAYAEEVIYHVSAYHTNDHYNSFSYNNKTDGLGVRWKDVSIGTYHGSYNNEGSLAGTIVYVSKKTPVASAGNLTLSSDLSVTYGYPERLRGNVQGLMLVPSITAEYGGKKYAVAVSMVPSQWVNGDNAYLLSVIVK